MVDSESDDPGTIVVLGMHRSGTSLVSRMLEAGGVYFGAPEDLAPPATDNVRGFWEHLGIRAVNDALLARLGGDWRCPPESNDGTCDRSNDDLRERARTIVEDLGAASPLRAWKDPRTTLVLPFWRSLLGDRLRPVLCVRHPASVAASLEARDAMPSVLARFLWQEYGARAVADLAGLPVVVVGYEEVLRDPVGQSVRLAAALSTADRPVDADAMVGAVEPALAHHHPSNDRVSTEDGEHVALFAALGACAADRRAWESLRPTFPGRSVVFDEMMRDSARLAARLSELRNVFHHRDREAELILESANALGREVRELQESRRALERLLDSRREPEPRGRLERAWRWARGFARRPARKRRLGLDA